jgi:hypothetical protein
VISSRRDHLDQSTSSLLAEAERLAVNGRRLEAIALLTAANRSERHADVEARLVHLRREAFGEVDSHSTRASWPPAPPRDLFPDVTVPMVSAGDFDAETLGSGILCHGCLAVRRLVPPHHVAALVADIDAAMAGCAAWESDHAADTAPWFVPFTAPAPSMLGHTRKWVTNGGGVWTADSPRAMFDVLEVFEDIGLDAPLTGYLGERPALSVKKWTLRRVPTNSGTNWHQDGAFLGQGIRTVNCWLTLSHCGQDAPGLDIVPRRMDDILPTGTHGAMFDWSVGEELVEQVAGDTPILRPHFEPGDALFFDERFLHRTAVGDAMTRERYAIESWFFGPSNYPDDQVALVF